MRQNNKMGQAIIDVLAKIVGCIIAVAYQVWSRSWQCDKGETQRLSQFLKDGDGIILVFWHGKFLPLFALLKDQDATVFTSNSFRGRIISQVCHKFGHNPSLLPPYGQGNAFRHFLKVLKTTKIGAFAVDGPLGPQHKVQPGTIKMASSLGYLIVPVSMACDPKHVMSKRWDKRELPHWRAKMSLIIGDPIKVPAGLRGQKLAEWCERVANAINKVDQQAEQNLKDR